MEVITFYLLKEWDMNDAVSIERGLPEYGNASITHNVEFTLHPIMSCNSASIRKQASITSSKILKEIELEGTYTPKSNTLLDCNNILRNSCIIAENPTEIVVSSIADENKDEVSVKAIVQHKKPYAMFECKRVGVEEGNKKGPQTIEKAKQGAYVAQKTSSLQKIRDGNGNMQGIIYKDETPIIKPYDELLHTIICKENGKLLNDFTMSVGIVSNHGNWFTSENQNKELKVLAQSYDWLLFLSDKGLVQFVNELILSHSPNYKFVKLAFYESYKEGRKKNAFTKVKMDFNAHKALSSYFKKNIRTIESWFNVISPCGKDISSLKEELLILKNKNWRKIL